MIADNEARYIAAQWASGGDIFQVFATTGATEQPQAGERHTYESFLQAISTNEGLERLQFDGDYSADELKALYEYVKTVGPREEIPGWGSMPETELERESRQVWEEQERGYNQIVSEGLGLR